MRVLAVTAGKQGADCRYRQADRCVAATNFAIGSEVVLNTEYVLVYRQAVLGQIGLTASQARERGKSSHLQRAGLAPCDPSNSRECVCRSVAATDRPTRAFQYQRGEQC